MDHVVPPVQPHDSKIDVNPTNKRFHPYFKKIYLPFLAVLVLAIGLVAGVPLLKRVTQLLIPASVNLVDLSFSTPVTSLTPGQQFTVNVLIDAKTFPISAATVSATYQTNQLQLISVAAGPFLTANIPSGYSTPFVLTNTATAGMGSIIVGAACPQVVPTPNPATTPCTVRSGAGILATLTMQVQPGATPGTTNLSFDTSNGRTAVAATTQSTSQLGDSNSLALTILPTSSPTPLGPTPTPAGPTPTPLGPTPTPTSSTLNFRIKFQGVTTQKPNQQVIVTLRQGATDTSKSTTVTSDSSGVFSGSASATPGTYDILITGPTHLRKKMATALSISASTPLQDWTATPLRAGDINTPRDNKVDLLDYSALVLKFNPGATQTDASDLNLDNKVDLLDYSLLVTNFNPGVTGD